MKTRFYYHIIYSPYCPRYFKMFPECIGMDMTFGTKRQRRPLFLVAGIDRCNKAFTAFRAFLPSKQQRALRWVILKALPTLLGYENLRHVSFIASDMEESIAQSISSAITTQICPHAIHRYDVFHVFILNWKKLHIE